MTSHQRQQMVDTQIRGRGLKNRTVLKAMETIPRHWFVPHQWRNRAYEDRPLPIGYGQTISQPYIVALMTELVRPCETDRVLEIGTGCGYQTAVLAELVQEVYSIEIVHQLAEESHQRLQKLGYQNIHIRCGDGHQGWPEVGPFQIILVAAAPESIPDALLEQLAPEGRLVIPVGRESQMLRLIEKRADGSLKSTDISPVSFVPMVGGS